MKKAFSILMLLVAMLCAWPTQAQTLGDYTFSTGVDTSKWIDMSSAPTVTLTSGDYGVSSVQNIGFSFPFGETDTYTQYSVNSDGNFRLGSTVTGTSNYTTPFSSSNASINNPKINAFGCDGYFDNSYGHYVKAQVTVDAAGSTVFVAEICTGTYTSTTRSYQYKWQIHLYPTGTIEIAFPPASGIPSTAPAVSHQCGLCLAASDGWIITSSNNTATHFTGGSSTTNSSGTWFDANRYYRFERPFVSCARPFNLAFSDVDSVQATISWSDTNGASLWRIYWAPTSSMNLLDSVDVTDTFYTFYGLTANTAYTVSVMTMCDTSNSIAKSTSFRTLCGINATPFSEGFENRNSGDDPYCWTPIASGTSGTGTFPSIYNYASNARTGNAYFEFESTSGQTEVAALPSVDNLSGLLLRFYAACTNTNFVLEAGVMEDTSFVVVDTVQLTSASSFGSNAYHEYTVYYNNYFGYGNRMALRVTAAGSYTLMIDDLTVEEIPSCPDPSYFTLDSVGTDWAALSWVDNGSTSSWVLEYDTVPFTPGTGSAGNIEYPVDVNITLTGLDTGFTYYAYLHGDCGGDTSNNVFLQFTTLAGDPATVPYTCGFERGGSNGWEFINGSQTNHWMIGTATNNGGNKSLYITNNGSANSYSTSNTSIVYAYRVFNLPDTGEYSYSFDWKADGESSWDYLRVWLAPATATVNAGQTPDGGTSTYSYRDSNPSGWIVLDGSRLNQQGNWQTHTGTFLLNTPGTYQLILMWGNDGSSGTQPPAAVDNISLARNSCPAPSGLTVSGVTTDEATLSWVAGGSESEWVVSDGTYEYTSYDTTYTVTGLTPDQSYSFVVRAVCNAGDTSLAIFGSAHTLPTCFVPINFAATRVWGDTVVLHWTDTTNMGSYDVVYGPQGFNPDTVVDNIFYSIAEDTIEITGLTIGSVYQFYVRTNCLSGDNSAWVGPVTATPGYSMNMPTTGTQTITNACGATIYDNGGATGDYSTDCNATMVLYPNAGQLLRLYGTYDCENGWDYLRIYDGASASATMVFESAGAGTIDTITATTGPLTIVFTSDGSVVYPGFELHVICMEAPECSQVLNLAVMPGPGAAMVTWDVNVNDTANYSGATVEYKEATDVTWTTLSATGTSQAISGLTANTLYDLRVATECFGATASWVTTQFTTPDFGCLVVDPNASSSDTIGNGTSTSGYFPTYSLYNYALSQQIYTATELGSAGNITSIAVMPQTVNSQRNTEIYMAHTSQTSLSGFIHPSDMTLVYTGTTAYVEDQWHTFTLDTPFPFNGTDNLLICFRDMTGSWTTSNQFYVHSSTGSSVYVYQDSGPYDPFTESGGSTSSYRNNMIFAKEACLQQTTCANPPVLVEDVTPYSVDLVWAAAGSENGWNVYAMSENDSVYTYVGSTSTPGYQVTGLISATGYRFKVVANCSSDSAYTIVDATTACGPAPLPYTEDFENASGTFSRACWIVGTTNLGSSYPYPTVVNLTGDPNKLLLMYNGAYVVMPRMDAPLNQLQIRFYFVQGGDEVRFLMGLMDDPNDPISSMQVLDTIIRSEIDSTTAYINYTYRFDQLTDDDSAKYIAFWDAFNDNYSFLDNIVVEYIPNCASVTGLSASNITDNSADINWTEDVAGTSYIIEYGPHGFTPGTGTTDNASMAPYTLTGLNSSTYYDAYIYTVCGTDTSVASQVLSFTTACGAVTALPYTMNFEGYVGAGSTATNILPPCWSTEATGAYIYYNSSTAQAPSQSYALQLMGNGIVVLPEMGVQLDSLVVTFHNYNDGGYGLVVGAVDATATTYAANFVPVDTILFENGVNESMVTSYLTDYTGTDTRIAIKAYGNSGTGVSHYIDNLTIDRIPNCIAPQRVQCAVLTNVSADITWRTSQAPSYSVEYGPHGFTPGTGTSQTVTTRNISLTGLTPLTQYDVRLVSLCSASEVSDTTVFTFTTLRAAPVMTYPYICDFADSAIANAWEPVNGTQNNKWYLGSAAHYGTADNMAYYVTDNNGTSNSYSGSASHTYIYRTFNMPAGSYNVSFKWQANGEGSSSYAYDYLRAFLAPADADIQAGYCPDGTTSSYNFWNVTPAGWISLDGSQPLRGVSSWQTRSEDVTISTTGTYNLVFYWGNDGSVFNNPAGAIDNIEISRNVCRVINLVQDPAVPVSSSQIAVRWDTNGASIYELEYGPVGFAHGTGTLITTTGNTAVATGLDGLTSYEFCVRGICNGTDTGAWTCATFRTEMCDNITIAESWDSTMSSSSSDYVPMGYSYYNYGYVQTLIDSAQFANISGDITAFAFKPATSSEGSYYNHISVYMANVPETSLSSFIVPDSNHVFVPVITDANMCYSDANWQLHGFDTAFTWDGHSNVLVAIKRDHGSYSSGASFSVHSTPNTRSLYLYQDSDPISITSPSASNSGSEQSVGDFRFYSCAAGCTRPNITSTTGTYQSATMNWTGNGTAYEVAIKAVSDAVWPAETAVTGNTYTFTGLQPATPYQLRVRQNCTADSLGYSAWATTTFVTDSLPCLAPDTFGVIGTTNATATFAWLPAGNETVWEIHVFSTTFDSLYTVTTIPATVGGFTAGATYYASIRALCGDAHNIEGEWGDTVQFTAATCESVTGLTSSNVTFNSVTLSWTAVTGAMGYRVVCTDGQDYDTVTVTTNTHTFTGLYDETSYTFYVQTVCGTGWYSENWAQLTVTTAPATGTTYYVTASANNAAYGSVTGGGTYAANATATLTATPNTGYSFTRWNDNVTTNPRSIVVTSDTTFTAIFTVNQYTVTVVNANPTMGAVSGTGTYAYNTTATITATPNNGYHFTGWNDGDTNTTRTITVTSDTTFTAGFAPNQYTVTAVPNDASMGSVTGSGTYNFGDTATLTATPNTGYGFRGWSDGNTSNPRSLIVTGDISLTANFSNDTSAITEYTVTLTVNDPAMGTLSNYGGTYAEGSTIVVTATANAGYHFVNWSDDNTENPRTFIVNNDITLQANFAQNVDSTAVLTIVVEGNGSVTINGVETTTYRGRLGDQVTLSAEAYEGYRFTGWSDGNTDATRSYTLTENNATLTATFGSVGIDAVATASCTLYPNPAKGATTVSVTGISGKVRIAVLDLSGREVLAETLECAADCEKSLDIEGLAEGAYFVRITSEGNAPMVKKLIVR